MNWFKMAKFNDWEEIAEYLRVILNREPTSYEIQQEILRNSFKDTYKDNSKKETVLAKNKLKYKTPVENTDKKTDFFEKRTKSDEND